MREPSLYRYSVYDHDTGEYENYESATPPVLEIRYDNLPFQVLDNFAIPLPQVAFFTGRTELPQGPDAIIASWTQREHEQPAPPEEQADDGAFMLRAGLAFFLGGVMVGTMTNGSTNR